MGLVYVLRSGEQDLFKVGRTQGTVAERIAQLSTGNPHPLTEFASIETDRHAKCETFLHNRLRSRKVRLGGGNEFYAITPAQLDELLEEAREFVSVVLPRLEQAARVAQAVSDEPLREPDAAERAWIERLLEVREAENRITLERARLEAELKLALGKAAGLAGLATFKTETLEKFDESAFRAAHPTLHAAFVRTSRRRPFKLL